MDCSFQNVNFQLVGLPWRSISRLAWLLLRYQTAMFQAAAQNAVSIVSGTSVRSGILAATVCDPQAGRRIFGEKCTSIPKDRGMTTPVED